MVRSAKKPADLRDSWRAPEGADGRSRWSRRFRRWAILALLATLVAAWYYALFQPAWHPNVHLFTAVTERFDERGAFAARFSSSTAAALRERAAGVTVGDPASSTIRLRTPDDFTALAERLRSDDVRSDDVVIVWLQASGIVIDGRPLVICENFTVADPSRGQYPFELLVQALVQSPAHVKLLLLESGGERDPRLGQIVNDFPRLARDVIEATDDPGLWLLSATLPGEQSNVDPGLKQTVFGHYVGRALGGEADGNADRVVDVDELFRFVRLNVAAWVDDVGGGFAPQTPALACGRRLERGATPDFPVVVPVGLNLQEVAQLLAVPAATAAPPAPGTAEPPTTTSPQPAVADKPPAAPPSAETAASPPTPEAAAAVTANAPASASAAAEASPPPDPLLLTTRAPSASPPVAVSPPKPDAPVAEFLDFNRAVEATLVDRSRRGPNPIDYAPQRWHVVQDAVVEFERRTADSSEYRNKFELALRRFAAAFATFASSGAPEPALEPLNRLAAWRAPPPIDGDRLPTWALVERLAADGGAPESAEAARWMSQLDAAFADAKSDACFELAAKPWPAALDRFDEFRFARRLATLSDAPWRTLQWAWRTCREGEQAAADWEVAAPSIGAQVVAADRLCETARRALFDQIGADWAARADADFRRALIGYRSAAGDAAELRRAAALRNDLLAKAPAYAAWYYDAGGDPTGAPTYDALAAFFDELRDFAVALDDQSAFDPAGSVDRRRRLERWMLRVAEPLRPAAIEALSGADAAGNGVRRRIDLLLRTPLLAPQTRRELENAAARIDAATQIRAAVADDGGRLEYWPAAGAALGQFAVRAPELDARLARLADFAPPDGKFPSNDVERSRQTGEALRRFYERLPAVCDAAVRDHGDLTDSSARATNLEVLAAADRAYRLMDVRDAVRSAGDSPGRVLRRAAWRDQLEFQRARFERRRADVVAAEEEFYVDAAEKLAEAARSLPREPAPQAAAPAGLRLVGPTAVTPGEDQPATFAIGVEYLAARPEPIWVSVDYDPELLDVKLPATAAVYDEFSLRRALARVADEATARWDLVESLPPDRRGDVAAARRRFEQARDAAAFPPQPQLSQLPPTVDMKTGDIRELRFEVRRRSAAAGRARFVVRAVAGATHARHVVEMSLPPLESIRFAPAVGSAAWSPRADGIVLHPWPNRTSDYEFQLMNLGTAEALVDVEFLAPEQRPEGTLPRTLRTVETSEVAALVGPAQTIVKIDQLKLPGSGVPVTLAAPKPKDAAAPPPTPDEANQADSTVGRSAADKDAPPPVPVRQGMLLVVRRRDNGETLLRRIDFRPERPRSYVRAKVGYNPTLERIEIRATPIDRASFPTGGVDVRASFSEPLARGTEAQLQGLIQAPDYEAVLYIEAPASDSRVQTVYLDVDGYPRAFVYRVPCGPASSDLPEADDVLDVRLTSPAPDTIYPAPAESIAVELAVDAPPGSFEFERDVLEVGIDRDRDRDFAGESTLVLHSDRQADVFLQRFGTNGIVSLRADVHDFRLGVPGAALQNVRVNLLARAQVGPRVAYSRPVEIGLDGAPPQVARVEVRPSRDVPTGGEFEVDVWTTDAEMSGTSAVEVGFDVDGSGKFSETKPPVKAAMTAPPRWTAKLPTADLPTGPVTILVRATDKVGLVGEFTKIKARVLSPADVAARDAAGSRVAGSLRYGGLPVPKATITLEGPDAQPVGAAESDAEGRFVIDGVPPGTYRLAARGVARNRPRNAEQQIVVPPPPARAPRVELDLK